MPLYRAELLAKKPLRYAALIHDVSQVLYLPFDWDDGSKARDRSGCNNHGTIYGATLTAGKIGMGRKFDGIDDYIEMVHNPVLNPRTGSFSVFAWVYPLTPPAGTKGVYCKAVDWAHCVMLGNDGLIMRARIGDGVNVVEIYEDTLPDKTWSFYGMVRDKEAGTLRRYLNLSYKEVADTTNDINPVSVAHIGTILKEAYRWNKMIIDEVRIYNRALSRDEIRMLMYRRLV